MKYEKKSLLQMARGAFMEIFDTEMAKVLDNITDPDTSSTHKRKLAVTFTFTPDEERHTISVVGQCKTTLAPVNAAVTALYITGESNTGEVTAVEMTPEVPGQTFFDGDEQEALAALKITRRNTTED